MVLPNGERLDFNASLCSLQDGLDKRARELLEAIEYVPSLLPGFSGDIFLGGHSYGCPSALLAAQRLNENQKFWNSNNNNNKRVVSGLILHDPALSMGRGIIKMPPSVPTRSKRLFPPTGIDAAASERSSCSCSCSFTELQKAFALSASSRWTTNGSAGPHTGRMSDSVLITHRGAHRGASTNPP